MSGEVVEAVPVAVAEPVAVAAVPKTDADLLVATLKAGLVTFGYNIPEFDSLAAAAKIKATA